MGKIFEWYGYPAADTSASASASAADKRCPFVSGPCTKPGGVCSVDPGTGPIPVCPIRLYFDNYSALQTIAEETFGEFGPYLDHSGRPVLAKGSEAVSAAVRRGQVHVGVFGKGWGGEIKLPPAHPGAGRYSIDYVLVAVDQAGSLLGIVPVEVQTIDTVGSYRQSLAALNAARQISQSTFGMNWENVNKRILPQLIIKGLMLQAEHLCASGIFFLTPKRVYDRIMLRLGGSERFRAIPRQPGSITFVIMDYGAPPPAGSTVPLVREPPVTISTSDLSIAFITPENLPPAGSYEQMVAKKL